MAHPEQLFWIREDKIKQIAKIFREMNKAVNFEETMQILMHGAIELLSLKRICIFLTMKDDTEKMILKYGLPEEEHSLGLAVELKNHRLLSKVMKEKAVFIAYPLSKEDPITGNMADFCKDKAINAILFIRLTLPEKPIGALVLDAIEDKLSFSDKEQSIALMISEMTISHIQHDREINAIIEANLAHELRNPLAAAGGFAHRTVRAIETLLEKLEKDLSGFNTKRKREIVSVIADAIVQIKKIAAELKITEKELARCESLANTILARINPNNLAQKT